MRLLTRLVLAGACAVTAWLLTGVVTIRAVDDPVRIGLLPSVHVPLIAYAIFLALSGAVRQPDRAAGAVALACLATLPWWPVPLPPALLLLAGPLGWAWLLVCLACAVVLPSGGWWWWRARRLLADPARAPWLAATLALVTLTAAALHTAPRHPDGDEPDYLIITQSLLYDGDLQIENNHRRVDYEAYHDGVLPPSYLQRGRNGQIYPVHAAGLPVLLLPGFALAGYPGAVATIILLCACGVALLWRLAYLVTDAASAAWLGTAAAAGAAPWFLHAFVVFPDAPASVLALVGVWVMLEPARVTGWRWALPALALAWLPWMHTRYVIVAAGLGLGIVAAIWGTRVAVRAHLTWFVGPAALGAALWFGFFWVVYGTPDPSAPYGSYTQTAWRQIPPGLVGLLVDQQFGLLAAAPVLALAVLGVPGLARRLGASVRDDGETAADDLRMPLVGLTWTLALTGLAYLLLTASYRMWWGGLSAPARFLAPLVLPCGIYLALAWQAVRTPVSRRVVLLWLTVSLALTTVMVVVDGGRLAYNDRDGYARWADWASPVVDLAGALPASHRDAPHLVARDAGVWLTLALGAWVVLRAVARRREVTGVTVVATMGLVVVAATTAVWWLGDRAVLHPVRSQVRWLLREAAAPEARRLLLVPPSEERRRPFFDLDLLPSGARALDAYTALEVDDLPAGRYRVFASDAPPGTRFGVSVGVGRAASFVAEMTATGPRAATEVVLPVGVRRLVVRASQPMRGTNARVWVRPDDVFLPQPGDPIRVATSAVRHGDLRVYVPGEGVYAEPAGVWVAGDTETFIGLAGPPGQRVVLPVRAGARRVDLRVQVGPRVTERRLEAGEAFDLDVGRMPTRGAQVVRVRVVGGFRPALVTEGSDDARRLGVWVAFDAGQ